MSDSGLPDRGDRKERNVALIPATRSLPGEVERLFPTNEAFRGSRNNFKLVALDGGEVSRLGGKRFADHGEVLAEGLIDENGSDDGSVGDVFSPAAWDGVRAED